MVTMTVDSASLRSISINPLTSLRFFAACYVLLLHSGRGYIFSHSSVNPLFAHFLSNGYLGVSFFFILSGFILTYVYNGQLRNRDSTIRYGISRFARIYPVCLFALLVEVVLHGVDSPLAIPQFFLLQSWGPVDFRGFTNINGPSWTLSVELAFYILLPMLLDVLNRVRNLLLPVVALAFVMVWLRLPYIPSAAEPYQYVWLKYIPLPLLRLPEFMLGVCAALRFLRGGKVFGKAKNIVSFLTLLAIPVTLASSTSSIVAPLAALEFAFLIYLVAADHTAAFSNSFLGSKPAVFLGKASFSLYILQEPVHDILDILESNRTITRILYYPFLFTAAALSFSFFEENMRRLIHDFGDQNRKKKSSKNSDGL